AEPGRGGRGVELPATRRGRPPPPPAPPPAVPTPAPAASSAGNTSVHVVVVGDTLSKIAHRYHKSVNEIAKANNIQPTATLNVGDRLTIPGAQASAGKASAPAARTPASPRPPGARQDSEPREK